MIYLYLDFLDSNVYDVFLKFVEMLFFNSDFSARFRWFEKKIIKMFNLVTFFSRLMWQYICAS